MGDVLNDGHVKVDPRSPAATHGTVWHRCCKGITPFASVVCNFAPGNSWGDGLLALGRVFRVPKLSIYIPLFFKAQLNLPRYLWPLIGSCNSVPRLDMAQMAPCHGTTLRLALMRMANQRVVYVWGSSDTDGQWKQPHSVELSKT